MKKYIIIGVGAYLSDIFDIIHLNNGKVAKLYQNIPEVRRERVPSIEEIISSLGYSIEVHDSLDSFEPESDCEYAIGCVTPEKHVLITEMKEKYQIKIAKLIHPSALFGSNVHIGEGVLVAPGVVIGPNAYLDDFCVINRSVMIGHDTKIGKYARLAPSVSSGGLSEIGEGVSIGISATVIDRIRIGNWSIIGAGALVTKDMPEKIVAYGVPAKVIRENKG